MKKLFLYLLFLLPNLTGLNSVEAQPLAPRTAAEQQVIDAYSSSNKAVVHISSTSATYDFFEGASIQEGAGSGIIIDANNALVVTNHHVIEDASRVTVTLANGKTYPAIKVGSDPDNDIALIQIHNAPENLTAAELADSDKLLVGQRVLAIGNPFGLDRTLTSGIISSLGRTLKISKDKLLENLIQTDAAINQGNSGGPLLDTAGRVIGINTVILSKSGGNAGIGFAIPINQIKPAIPQLIKYGRVLRPKLGISISETDWGLLVLYVQPNGPADQAGIKSAVIRRKVRSRIQTYLDPSQGEYIVAINGKQIESKAQFLKALSKSTKPIKLMIRKGFNNNALREISIKPVLD